MAQGRSNRSWKDRANSGPRTFRATASSFCSSVKTTSGRCRWAVITTRLLRSRQAIAASFLLTGDGWRLEQLSPDVPKSSSSRFRNRSADGQYRFGAGCGRVGAQTGRNCTSWLMGRLMASTILASGSSFEAGTPHVLFPVQLDRGPGGHPQYAVSRDGRFLVNQITEATSNTPITLILNWKPKTP